MNGCGSDRIIIAAAASAAVVADGSGGRGKQNPIFLHGMRVLVAESRLLLDTTMLDTAVFHSHQRERFHGTIGIVIQLAVDGWMLIEGIFSGRE